MSTSTATAYKYSVAGHLSFGAPKCEKAQKSSGFWANRTYWLCIKDNVLIEYDIGAGGIMVHCRANAKYIELSNPNGQNVQKDVQKADSMEKKVLELITAQKDISLSNMADQLGVSSKTVQRAIEKLKEKGLIVRRGGKRFGYWEMQ